MQCDDIRLELQAYLEGELAPDERAEVEAHLSTCQACAEEARAMRGMGDLIRRGLNEWVDQGTVPAELAARIEVHIRPRKKVWWQNWQLAAGLVTAAAAVFLVLFTTQPERIASIPLLGALFMTPDFTYTAAPGPVTEKLPKPSNEVHPQNATTEKEGITLTVNLIEQVGHLTHIQYTIKGMTLDKERLKNPVTHPTLTAAGKKVSLSSFNADQRSGAIVFNAYFDALQSGQSLTLTIGSLPAGEQMVQGPWQVTFSN